MRLKTLVRRGEKNRKRVNSREAEYREVEVREKREKLRDDLQYDDMRLLYMCGKAVPTHNSAFGTPTGDKKRRETY